MYGRITPPICVQRRSAARKLGVRRPGVENLQELCRGSAVPSMGEAPADGSVSDRVPRCRASGFCLRWLLSALASVCPGPVCPGPVCPGPVCPLSFCSSASPPLHNSCNLPPAAQCGPETRGAQTRRGKSAGVMHGEARWRLQELFRRGAVASAAEARGQACGPRGCQEGRPQRGNLGQLLRLGLAHVRVG